MNLAVDADEDFTQPQIICDQHYAGRYCEVKLVDTIYKNCRFEAVRWANCYLENVQFVQCEFESTHFDECVLKHLIFDDCREIGAQWLACNATDLVVNGGDWQTVSWRGGMLKDAIFTGMRGAAWRFDEVRAMHMSWISCTLDKVSLLRGAWSDVSWVDVECVNWLIDGATLKNFIVGQGTIADCQLNDCKGANVRWIESNIERMTVCASQLLQSAWVYCIWKDGGIRASHLPLVCFDHSHLCGVLVVGSELDQAMLDDATLVNCDWRGVHAPRIGLRRTRLVDVQLSGAQLAGIDASGATLERVALNDADCSEGRLIEQSPLTWCAARTTKAIFDDPIETSSRLWRKRFKPGSREHENERH